MTIKDLKEIIKDLPDDMEVGITGHWGEFLSIDSAHVHKDVHGFNTKKLYSDNVNLTEWFDIESPSRGEDPSDFI